MTALFRDSRPDTEAPDASIRFAPVQPAATHERAAVEALLEAEGLILKGLWAAATAYVAARRQAQILGGYGLEFGGPACLLRSVVIAPAARGLGLGRKLEADARARAAAAGAEALYCFSTDAGAVAFFQSCGWEERPVAELVARTPHAPQVRLFDAMGTFPCERAWRAPALRP
jgi:N-acetylglutamate synthase-like GNAT family acetyltransferase